MNYKLLAEKIFRAGVESILPDTIIRRKIHIKNNSLYISGKIFQLDAYKNIYVIGFGKASALMAKEIEILLGNRIAGGHVIVKYGYGCALKYIAITEAGHPVPDSNGVSATQKIIEIAGKGERNDLIICLISGGGSALLTDVPEGVTLQDIIIINDLLVNSGADVSEINTVRKHLSKVKGGQLAKIAYPATLVSLILSDVIGDAPEVIASGPTASDSTTFSDAKNILEKYGLYSIAPHSIQIYIKKGIKGAINETPKLGDPVFIPVHNFIIGSNTNALEAAGRKAMELGLPSHIITNTMQGDTIETCKKIIEECVESQSNKKIEKPCCLLFGGETTLQVKGNGRGGRNQHMALYAAAILKDKKGITFLAAGTDGTDGPTSAAGAIADTKTEKEALLKGLILNTYLQKFDSFHFFQRAGGQVNTGPTMTNVMDMVIVIIE